MNPENVPAPVNNHCFPASSRIVKLEIVVTEAGSTATTCPLTVFPASSTDKSANTMNTAAMAINVNGTILPERVIHKS